MDKFKNKYRIPSARASWWNYARKGVYFITICTVGREHLFGEIINSQMVLSEIGKIVQQEWNKSFEIRAELFCDAFIIMPNHIHAIVRIDSPEVTHGQSSRQDHAPKRPLTKKHGVAYRPAKSISSFVAGFKAAAKIRINEYRNTPGQPVWQTRFHDHIIRNEVEYYQIKNYIETNPSTWENDKFFN